MNKHQILVDKHLPVQTQQKTLAIDNRFVQTYWWRYYFNATDTIIVLLGSNYIVIITFKHDITLRLGVFTVYFPC